MSQTVVQLPGNSGGLTHTHIVPLPSGVTAGERLTVAIAIYLNSPPPAPSGWTALFTRVGSTIFLGYYYKEADGSETQVTFETFPGNPKEVGSAWIASRRSGHDPSAAPEYFVDAIGRAGIAANTQSPNPPTLAPSWGIAPADFEALTGWRSAPAPNAIVTLASNPAGYDNDVSGDLCNNNSGAGIATASLKDSVSGAENPLAFGLSAVAATVANTVAHKSA